MIVKFAKSVDFNIKTADFKKPQILKDWGFQKL